VTYFSGPLCTFAKPSRLKQVKMDSTCRDLSDNIWLFW